MILPAYRGFSIACRFWKTGWEVSAACRHYVIGPFQNLPTKEAAIGVMKEAIDLEYEKEAHAAYQELVDEKIVTLQG